MRYAFVELYLSLPSPHAFLCDNLSATQLVVNPIPYCANILNNATSRITKDRKEREHTKFNEVRYKYLRPWTPMNNFH